MICVLLIYIVLANAIQQESSVLRIYSADRRQQTERQLHPVLSLCANIPEEGDFLLSLSSPCLKTPSDMRVFLVSRKAVLLRNLELVKVSARVLVRQLYGNTQIWEITLPPQTPLTDIDRIAIGIETNLLPCPARIPSELATLRMLISSGTVWTCALALSCPSLCTSARSLAQRNDCQEHGNNYYSSDYEEGDCKPETEDVSSNSSAAAVVAVITVFGWYLLCSVCFCVIFCIVGFILCLKRRRSIILNRLAYPVVVIPNQVQHYGAVQELDMWAIAVPFPSPDLLFPVPYNPSLSHFQETTCSICMQE